MRLPAMSSLQFLVLHLLFRGERTGKQLGEDLADHGVRRSQPTISRLVQRLVVEGYVDIEFRERIEGSQVLRERYYRVTDVGLAHWHATQEYYSTLPAPPPAFQVVETVPAKLVSVDRKTRDDYFKRQLRDAFLRFAEAELGKKLQRRR